MAIKVQKYFGAFRNEAIFRNALLIEFRREGVAYEVEKFTPVYYHEELVGSVRLDLVVEANWSLN